MTDDELGSGRRLIPRKRGLAQRVEGEAHGVLRSDEPTPVNDEPETPTWIELIGFSVSRFEVVRLDDACLHARSRKRRIEYES